MSAYFLQSSVLSTKLSSKLTDIYLVLAIWVITRSLFKQP